MASFNFPSTPALNDIYAPVGGPVFTWDGVAWKGTSQGAPVTVYVSDTAPLSPAIGQLWWNSATGTMAIWYADADSAQWVQVSGQVLPTAPSDNGEYVMVNGVWRLKEQSFNLAGATQLDIPVPVWGPSQARLSMEMWFPASAASPGIRVSIDGTTFPSGASDYFGAGFVHRTGATAPGIFGVPLAGATYMLLAGTAIHAAIPMQAVFELGLTRVANGDNFGYVSRATVYNTTAAILYETDLYTGYASSTAFPGTGNLKAIRWFTGTAPRDGRMTVEWLA